jgi:MFS family permease
VTTEASGIFSVRYRELSAALVALSTLVAFEYLAVATAMPVLAHELDGLALYGLAFSGALAAGVFATVLGGRWGDVRGPVAPLWTGIVGFVAGLLVAGFASSMPMFLGGRVLQGLGGGMFWVALYVLVARVYPSAMHPRVFSLLATAWVVPSMVGPAVTGLVVEHVGWRWVFLGVALLTVPAVIVLFRGLRGQPILGGQAESAAGLGRRLGWATATAVGAALMQYGSGLEAGGLPILAAGLVLLAVAVPPLLPRGTLRAATGLPAVVALRGVIAGAFYAAEVLIPLMLIGERGLSPTLAGLTITGGALSWVFASWLQGRGLLSRAFALRGGAVFVTVGVALMGLVLYDAVSIVVAYLSWIVAGFGVGMAYPTQSVLTLEFSADGEQGHNTSSLQVGEQVFSVVAIAVTSALFTFLGSGYLVSFAVAVGLASLGIMIAGRTYLPRGVATPPKGETRS